MPPSRFHSATTGLATLVLASVTAAAPIDFEQEIEPILRAHCLDCHGPLKQSAGLRLDSRSGAEAGGVSGLPVLGGTLETNELWRRVSAEDDEFRMPRFEDPLADSNLDRLRRWVEEGTPWPEEEIAVPDEGRPSVWISVYERGIGPTLPWLLALFGIALVLERLKARLRGRTPKLAGLASRLGIVHVLLVASVLVGVHQFFSTAKLQARYDTVTELPAVTHFGDPPVPRRPDHGRRLHGSYYRGNCERDNRLYNSGSYRTCTFHIALVDAHGAPLNYGDPIPAGGIFARFEIERARNTTGKLYTSQIMDAIFLSEEVLPSGVSPTPGRLKPLETIEPLWRWAATWPIPEAGPAGTVSGLVYVYRGAYYEDVPSKIVPHYALQYEIRTASGRIAPESELWLGALYVNSRVASPPEPGKVPFESWFTWLPLPEIEGEHASDPMLLGLPEHLGTVTE
jgi:hypothetical protein